MKKSTILYVDDSSLNLQLFRESFSDQYNIITVDNGKEALNLYSNNGIELVLADLMMPEMDGIEFLEKVVEVDPLPPRILLTAYGDLKSAKEAVNRCKIFYFMQKPWDKRELGLIMKHAINSYKQEISNRQLTDELCEKTKQLKQELKLNNKILHELKASDKKLKANEQYLQNLINSAGTVIIVVSKDEKIDEWNLEAEKYFKLTREQAIGNKVSDVIPSTGLTLYFSQALKDYAKNKIKENQEVNITGRDGIQYSFLWNISPLYNATTKTVSFIFIGQNVDIIRKAEFELKASEEKYKLLAENVSDVLWLIDIQGKLLYVSPSIQKLRGYTQEEVMKQNIFESIMPASRAVIEKSLIEFLGKIKNGIYDTKPDTFEVEQYCKDGSTIWTEIIVNKLYDEQKNFQYFLGVSRDISDRINAEKQLKYSEEKFSAIFNSSPESILLSELETGKIVIANDHFIQMMEMPKEDIINHSTIEIGFWGNAMQRKEFTKRIISDGNITNYEVLFNTRLHKSRFGLISAKTINLEDKVYILNVIVDITERKILEEELRQSEEQFRSIYENSVVGYFRADIEGNILLANPTFVQMLGYQSLDELKELHITLKDICKTFIRKEYLKEMQSKGKVVDFETIWSHRDKSQIYILENGIAIYDENKKIIYIDGTIIDISAKKDAEAQLLRSEQLFKAITEQTTEGIVLLGMNGKIILANDAFVQLSKYSLFEMLTMKFSNLIEEDANPPMIDLIKQRKIAKREVQLRNKNKDKFYIEIKGNIIYIGDKKHILIIINNIHEKYLSEKALRRSEARLREAQKMAHIGHYYYNNLDSKTEWSDEMYRIFGKSKDFALSNNEIRACLHESDQKYVQSEYEKAVKNKTKFNCEYRIVRGNGEIRYVAENGRIIYDNKGNVRRVIGTIQDITKLKEAELEIRKLNENLEQRILIRTKEYQESEKKFRTFLKYIPDGFLLINQNEQIMLANRQAEKLFGYKSAELIEKPLEMLIPDRFKKNHTNYVSDYYKNAYNQEMSSGTVFPAIRKSGEEFPADIRLGPVNIKEETYIICIIRDITDKKLAEDELKQAKIEAEAANKTKSEFLANMSHEIRTPLNAVLGITDLLYQQISDNVQRNYLDTIKSSSKTLLTLIDDILDLSKIEAGKLKLNYSYVSLGSLIEDVESIFSLRAKEKGLELLTFIDKTLPQSIYIDEIRLRQVLLNLISNAVKFTSKGYIKVSVDKLNIDQLQSKQNTLNISISVEDTGIGIKEPFLRSIFEAFTQQEDLDTRKYGGTGLGLAITNRLVRLMNGDISAKSEPGKGSEFTINLKSLKYSEEKTAISKNAENKVDKSLFLPSKIVIADDNLENRKFLKGVFARTKIEVFEASDGMKAFDLVMKLKPVVLITDIKMPYLDGFELSKKIKTHPELKHIHIIANSAAVMTLTKEILDEAYFDDFLSKPIDHNKLLELLKKYLPYSFATSKEINKIELPEMTISNVSPEIITELKKETLTHWEKIKNKQKIEHVTKFNEVVGKLGEQYHIDTLLNFNKELKSAVESFDIDTIIRLIGYFPELLDSLKSKHE